MADRGQSARNIPFVSKTIRSTSNGDDMETYSGYTSRSEGVSERTGAPFCFSERGDLLHHEILYPEGVTRFADAQALWQAVNAAERHPRAQFAYEVVLPLSPDIDLAHNRAMVESFARWYRVRHGVPVQIDLHAGRGKEGAGETGVRGGDLRPDRTEEPRANPHAHLLIPTRALERGGFGAKTRHLNPPFYQGRVMEEEHLRQIWADIQRHYGAEHGLDMRTDPTGFVPQPHMGPLSGRAARPQNAAMFDLVRAANAEAACDPKTVLAKLTENNATFDDDDVDRLLHKHLKDLPGAEEKIAVARADLFASPDLLAMIDKGSGDWSGRFSTRQVREQEQKGVADAAALARQIGGEASPAAIHAALARHPLLINERDQRAAFDYVVAPGKLKVIEGRAGTGKSYTLAAIRQAFEDSDARGEPRRRVIGLSHMHVVKEEMKSDGFREAYTVQRMLKLLEQTDGAIWDGAALVAIDEAAMLSTAQLAGTPANDVEPASRGLLDWARRTGTKLVLVGDDRQLPAIERGGLFTAVTDYINDPSNGLGNEAHSRELTKVRRQRKPWQSAVAEDLARYDFDKAVRSLEAPRLTASGAVEPGRISWRATQASAADALVEAWRADAAGLQDGVPDPVERQFVFAFTHREVDDLNARLRRERRLSGRLGHDVALDVCYKDPRPGEPEELHRDVPFAVGDRVQFTRNDENRGIFNGSLATIQAMRPCRGVGEEHAWEVTALVDGPRGKRPVSWTSDTFNGLRHGYAGTGWKAQSKTIDRTYHLFSKHWTAPLSYMLLTRQREDTQLFVASPDGQPDPAWLARQMAHHEIAAASVAWDAQMLGRLVTDRPPAILATPTTRQRPASGMAPRSGPRVEIDIAFGRDQFRRKVAQTRGAREALAQRLVADWDQRLTAFRQLPREADNAAAREQLAASARAIAAEPWITAMMRREPAIFGNSPHPELHTILDAQDPLRAIEPLLDTLDEQPHRLPEPPAHHLDTRTRDDRHTRSQR